MSPSDAIAAEIRTQISAKISDAGVATPGGSEQGSSASQATSNQDAHEPVLARKPAEPLVESAAEVAAASVDLASHGPGPNSSGNPASPTVNAVASTVHAPQRSAPLNVRWAAAWLVTAAIPALVVWAVMRRPQAPIAAAPMPQSTSLGERVVAAAPEAQPLAPSPPSAATESAAAGNPAAATVAPPSSNDPEAPPPVASSDGTVASASAEGSATLPATAVPTFVATDSEDRVAVVVTSRPSGARIFRRGKGVGRTPVSIEIGKGERRTFEIGAPGYATRKLVLDGSKAEVEVRLSLAPAPQVVQVPSPGR